MAVFLFLSLALIRKFFFAVAVVVFDNHQRCGGYHLEHLRSYFCCLHLIIYSFHFIIITSVGIFSLFFFIVVVVVYFAKESPSSHANLHYRNEWRQNAARRWRAKISNEINGRVTKSDRWTFSTTKKKWFRNANGQYDQFIGVWRNKKVPTEWHEWMDGWWRGDGRG